MYRQFRNVPIFKDIPPICSYFLGFRVGKYALYVGSKTLEYKEKNPCLSDYLTFANSTWAELTVFIEPILHGSYLSFSIFFCRAAYKWWSEALEPDPGHYGHADHLASAAE